MSKSTPKSPFSPPPGMTPAGANGGKPTNVPKTSPLPPQPGSVPAGGKSKK